MRRISRLRILTCVFFGLATLNAQAAPVLIQPVAPFPDGLVKVSGGTFTMGDTAGDGYANEKPIHQVRVSSFYIGKYELTQREWVEVMGGNPSNLKGDTLPVEVVSWNDAVDYCNKRSVKEGLIPAYTINETNVSCDWGANGYRLPTEAEWEYAAKGAVDGSSQNLSYAGSSNLDNVAWYGSNSGMATHPVGQKQANSLGIFDMSGNVWEWCWDWYDAYGNASQTDPRGPFAGESRVLRGGSWSGGGSGLRCAFRLGFDSSNADIDIGFRVVRSAQ